ncbi:MAG: iron-containing alcohol dehydrogenase, partial [Polyangiaceae bacterium]|nr:iron-containing alcohol dehydrogenase [Polyangiaceae bacterium]
MTVAWSFPTRVVFGDGAIAHVAEEATRLGAKRALIVTDEAVNAAGLVSPVQSALEAIGVECAVFTGVSPNPLESDVLSAADAFRQHAADLVVAVGGGSPLDVGKLVRLAATHPLPLSQYD